MVEVDNMLQLEQGVKYLKTWSKHASQPTIILGLSKSGYLNILSCHDNKLLLIDTQLKQHTGRSII